MKFEDTPWRAATLSIGSAQTSSNKASRETAMTLSRAREAGLAEPVAQRRRVEFRCQLPKLPELLIKMTLPGFEPEFVP